MKNIDLNSDLGESFGAYKIGDDAAMLDIVSSANIACGFHGGDPSVMRNAYEIAKSKGVNIGAHPGFHDLYGFGRRIIKGDSMRDIENQIAYQIGASLGIAALTGAKVTYVKPHGALSNMAQEDEELAMAIAKAIKGVDKTLIFMVMPMLEMEKAGEKLGLKMVSEIFADRTYADNGNVTSRKIAGSVLHDKEQVMSRLLEMLETSTITSTTGKKMEVKMDTVCVHSDTPQAVDIAKHIRTTLEAKAWKIKAFR